MNPAHPSEFVVVGVVPPPHPPIVNLPTNVGEGVVSVPIVQASNKSTMIPAARRFISSMPSLSPAFSNSSTVAVAVPQVTHVHHIHVMHQNNLNALIPTTSTVLPKREVSNYMLPGSSLTQNPLLSMYQHQPKEHNHARYLANPIASGLNRGPASGFMVCPSGPSLLSNEKKHSSKIASRASSNPCIQISRSDNQPSSESKIVLKSLSKNINSVGSTLFKSYPTSEGIKEDDLKTGSMKFPNILYKLLMDAELNNDECIICFLPHGRSFIVNDVQAFEKELMPKYFKMSVWKSFRRQLNLYDFNRVGEGHDKGSYYHKNFVRGRPELLRDMKRTRLKGERSKNLPNYTAPPKPNFS